MSFDVTAVNLFYPVFDNAADANKNVLPEDKVSFTFNIPGEVKLASETKLAPTA